MSENFNQSPDEPEEAGQPLAEADSPQQPASEQPTSPAFQAAQPQPLSESIIPERPEAAYPQYPPPPEFYARMPDVNPQASSVPSVPPVQNVPGFPPPPAYGYGFQPSPYGYGFPPLPQAQPLPLGQAIRELPRQYKKILFKPGVRAFAEEQGKADWGIIWLQLLFLTIVQVAVIIPFFLTYNQALATNPSLASAGVDASLFSSPTFLVVEIVLEIVLMPLLFLAGVGIQYLVARAFKGMGSFKQQAYNQLLFQMPLGLITAALTLVLSTVAGRALAASVNLSTTGVGAMAVTTPLSGPYLLVLMLFDLVSLAIWVYTIILTVFSLMAVHRLSGGRATASVLILYGALFLIGMLCACAALLVTISAMPH